MHFVPFLRLSTSRFLPNLRLIKWAARYNSESVKFWHFTAENGSLFLWNSPVTRIGDKSTSLWMALQLNSQRRMAESSAGRFWCSWPLEAPRFGVLSENLRKVIILTSWSHGRIDPGDPTKSMDLMLQLKEKMETNWWVQSYNKDFSEVKTGTGSHC